MALPDQWTEIAYVAISDEDGNEYQFGTITDSLNLGFGARDIEAIATISAGRIIKFVPEEITEIDMDIFPIGCSSNGDGTTPYGVLSWFLLGDADAASGIITNTRLKFRVTVLWTDKAKASVTNAAGEIATANSFRMSFWNCYMTQATNDFTDKILKSSVKFKCPPYSRAASGLIKIEEEDDSGTLSALGTYAGAAPS